MKLHSVISDGIIYQRNKPIFVTGTGVGTVKVSFLGEEKTLEANGEFAMELSPRPAGGPYEMEITLNGKTEIIHDILIGEVIVVAGQSNAELPISETFDAQTHFSSQPHIRYYLESFIETDCQKNPVLTQTPYTGKWVSLETENAPYWSAIALHSGLSLFEKAKVPIGILCCYRGATVIESFLSEEILEHYSPEPEKLASDHFYPDYSWGKNSYLYHNLLLPLIPLQCKGVIWYQGESNRTVYEAENYYIPWLCDLVSMWRNLLKCPELPFAIVQINHFPAECDEGIDAIRHAQKKAMKHLDFCALVTIDDMGEWDNIHPRNKKEATGRMIAALESITSFD